MQIKRSRDWGNYENYMRRLVSLRKHLLSKRGMVNEKDDLWKLQENECYRRIG